MKLVEDALKAACPSPLLNDECHDQRALQLCGIQFAQHFDKRDVAEPIADSSRGSGVAAEIAEAARYGERAENIRACVAGFLARVCANVHVKILNVAGLRRIGAAGLQVHGESCDGARYPFAVRCFEAHGLCRIEFVEQRQIARLR